MKRLFYLILLIPTIALSQNREIYLSKDYNENGKTENFLFRFYFGVVVVYRCKCKEFNIDSLESASNMIPTMRLAKGREIINFLNEPTSELIKYQDELNTINDCESTKPPLIVYIKENNIVYEIKIKDYGKCKNKIYKKKALNLIDAINWSINGLLQWAPGG